MGNFAAEAKKISNDPYIPLDKKLELMNQLNNEVCLVNEAHQEFVKSNQYRDMPTDPMRFQHMRPKMRLRLKIKSSVQRNWKDLKVILWGRLKNRLMPLWMLHQRKGQLGQGRGNDGTSASCRFVQS